MSSDYIPRLRRELLRAGATKPSRWTSAARGLRPLAAAAAVAAVLVAVVLAFPRGDNPTIATRPSGALHLRYRGEPSSAVASARVMRDRLAAAGVRGAGVSVASGGAVAIAVPASARADVTALVRAGRVAIYDWERSVLGPRGDPAPEDATVTGGTSAGQAATTTKAVAEARAARHPAARAVRAERSGGWFALGGPAALTNAEILRARSASDPATHEPIVVIDLTAAGQRAFATLTRGLAHRGSANAHGGGAVGAAQHLAIVVDDRIVSVPFIDFRQAPNGIDGTSGVQIQGGLTKQSARRLAALLSFGPLPAALEPAG